MVITKMIDVKMHINDNYIVWITNEFAAHYVTNRGMFYVYPIVKDALCLR